MKRLLFVGPIWHGSTSTQRMSAFQEIGMEVEKIDTTSPNNKHSFLELSGRIGRRVGIDLDLAEANRQLLEITERFSPDIIWIEKGLTIKPKVLFRIKQCHPAIRIIAYSPDNMAIRANQSRSYLHSIPLYDWHVTHKSFNVQELRELGAIRVYYAMKSFDSNSYCSQTLTRDNYNQWGGDVAFLGGFERPRYETMLAVAKSGIPISIWGPGWEQVKDSHPNLLIHPGWVQAVDAAKVFAATKVNLHFLRKVACDLHTARSIEIPACNAFMLAERTQEHLELFEESREAEYFGDTSELIKKIKYYLQNEQQRLAIVEASYQRSLDYTNHQRLREILDVVIA